MRKSTHPEDLEGVFAVPPLARREDQKRSLDLVENERLVEHILRGGVTRLLYGGNAFLYHVTLNEYEQLVAWLDGLPDTCWCIPSVGPSFGRALDQAPFLRRHRFPMAMALPCADPRDAAGLARGLREISDAAGLPLMLYLKDETNFGADRERGLDAVAELVNAGVCAAIKYAVVRSDPEQDAYLEALLRRVDRRYVISGIGERPAVSHLRKFGLPGFTTGSGCVAPALSEAIFHACRRGDWETAGELREKFLPLEGIRDRFGPARVLHHAVEAAGIAKTGPISPFVSPCDAGEIEAIRKAGRGLMETRAAGGL
ncbi:MAG: dihydrodipicolinate synthase family protein [Acidobacteria bacterium]|nr:dihydrodipicolinate synthase family protein [Acidobacteriota bacterium]MBI3278776.1 dihydrodipicolinate synthase family protein [Acidobacteriota bacterium]